MNTAHRFDLAAFFGALATAQLTCCQPTDPRVVFGVEGRGLSLDPIVAPSTAVLRPLVHQGSRTLIAMGGDGLGLAVLDPAGETTHMFDGETIVEVDRDPLDSETLVVFLEERSRFEIVRGDVTSTRSSGRYVRDFLLADQDGDGTTDIVALSEGGEVFVIPSYASAPDFDAVARTLGSVGAVREQLGHSRPRRIDVGDFDADDAADIVVAPDSGGPVVLLGAGQEMIASDASADAAMRAELDGQPGDEIVTYGEERYTALRWSDDAFAVYGGESEIADELDIGDLNGDGLDDVVLLHSEVGPVMLATSRAGGLAPLHPVDVPGSTDARSVAAGDFDGDGRTELALLRFSPSQGCH